MPLSSSSSSASQRPPLRLAGRLEGPHHVRGVGRWWPFGRREFDEGTEDLFTAAEFGEPAFQQREVRRGQRLDQPRQQQAAERFLEDVTGGEAVRLFRQVEASLTVPALRVGFDDVS
ncbi:hypothetical protein CTI14_38870 [Methylobacterium radiotolerans]|nr:hypothetical protein CTI14_38870 [Methylobacterium radiotolerans]